jgi:hypothetical protein
MAGKPMNTATFKTMAVQANIHAPLQAGIARTPT